MGTNRGLTINAEVAWADPTGQWISETNAAWDAAIEPAVPLTDDILDEYVALRDRIPPPSAPHETESVPNPIIESDTTYPPFRDAENPLAHGQLWIQSYGMQGGSQTQLELPRGAHRFFGPTFNT